MNFTRIWKRQNKIITHEQLIGKWHMIHAEGNMEPNDNVTMRFDKDGRLTYTYHLEDKDQIIFLTYFLDGDNIITDQPSDPRKQTTKASLDPEG